MVVFRLWAFCEKITKSVGRGAEECGDEEEGGIGEGKYKLSSSGFGEKAIRSSNNLLKVSALLFMAPTNASKGEKGLKLKGHLELLSKHLCVSVLLLLEGQSGCGRGSVGGCWGDRAGGLGKGHVLGVGSDEGLVPVDLSTLSRLASGEIPHQAVRVFGVVGPGAVRA